MLRVVFLFLAVFSTGVFAKTPAQELFEEAYNIESEEPGRAIRLYERVLGTDLEDELRSTVKWRLAYLYKRMKQFTKAFLLVESLGREKHTKSILAEIRREMAFHWEAQDAAVVHYLEGVRLLRKNPDEGAFLGRFRLALRGENPFLLLNIVDQLSRAGLGGEALKFLETHGDNSSGHALLRADLLFSLDRVAESESILRDLAAYVSLAPADKAKVLYLLGRMNAARRDYRNAVTYFRLATHYFSPEDGGRQSALAAYNLYRAGLPLQALALLRSLEDPEDENIRLLLLILKVEVDGDPDAVRALFRMRDDLRKSVESGDDSFLVRQAYGIVNTDD